MKQFLETQKKKEVGCFMQKISRIEHEETKENQLSDRVNDSAKI